MKTILLLCSFTISANLFCQSILSDKKNASSNTRKITTGTNPIYKANIAKTVQVQSQLNIQTDSIMSYELNFTAPDLLTINNTNSFSNTCLLTAENGTIFNGVLDSEASEFSLINSQQFYTCKFSKDDFYKIIALKITDIKIITAAGKEELFSVDEKLQDIISKQAKAMLTRFKTNSLK